MTEAPYPEVDHQGHSPGPFCDLPLTTCHPSPCPGTDKYGNPCLLPPPVPLPEATADVTTAPAVVELALQKQLEKLQKEKEEADTNAELKDSLLEIFKRVRYAYIKKIFTSELLLLLLLHLLQLLLLLLLQQLQLRHSQLVLQ